MLQLLVPTSLGIENCVQGWYFFTQTKDLTHRFVLHLGNQLSYFFTASCFWRQDCYFWGTQLFFWGFWAITLDLSSLQAFIVLIMRWLFSHNFRKSRLWCGLEDMAPRETLRTFRQGDSSHFASLGGIVLVCVAILHADLSTLKQAKYLSLCKDNFLVAFPSFSVLFLGHVDNVFQFAL